MQELGGREKEMLIGTESVRETGEEEKGKAGMKSVGREGRENRGKEEKGMLQGCRQKKGSERRWRKEEKG